MHQIVQDKIQPLIQEYGNELAYSDSTIREASEFVQNKELYLKLFQGRTPRSVAIVSLYLSGLSNYEYRTREELKRVSKLAKPAMYQFIRKLVKMKRKQLKDVPIIKRKIEEGKIWGQYAPDKVNEVTATMECISNLIPSLRRREKDEKYKKAAEELSTIANKLVFN